MILPDDNSILLAGLNDDSLLDDAVAPSLADLQALLPGWALTGASVPRDAMLLAWGRAYNLAQARIGGTLAAMATPRNASEDWLDLWGEELRLRRAIGEDDGDYRARLLAPPDVVSPNAIRDAVDPIVAEDTSVPAAYAECDSDTMFAGAVGGVYTCFAQPVDQRLWGVGGPMAHWGVYIGRAAPGGMLVIGVPIDPSSGSLGAFAAVASSDTHDDLEVSITDFVGDSTHTVFTTSAGSLAASLLIDRVFDAAWARMAAGVGLVVFGDPGLASAV